VTVPVDSPQPGSIQVTAAADLNTGEQIATTRTVPVIASPAAIEPITVNIAAASVLEVGWGSGPSEVGFDDTADLDVPHAFDLLSQRNEYVVLDTVNRRLLTFAATGAPVATIPLPGPGWLDNAVVVDNERSVFVLEYENLGDRLSLSGLLIDLQSHTVDRTDPFLLEHIPILVPLLWNAADNAVYMFQPAGGGWFRVYDIATKTLIIDTLPHSWTTAYIDPEQSLVGITSGSTSIGVRVPLTNTSIESVIGPDGDIWSLVVGLDPASTTIGPEGDVLYELGQFLVRIRPSCLQAAITEIHRGPQSQIPPQELTVHGQAAYLVDIDIATSYRVLSIELPAPNCPAPR
jgi:hypothetical protein